MMNFRTSFLPPQNPFPIAYDNPILALGSCFIEHIGGRLEQLGYPILNNPFGITYNPASISQSLLRLCQGYSWQPEDLIQGQGLWHSLAHYGRFSMPEMQNCLENIQKSFDQAQDHLKKTDILFLTLGTAWVYEHKGRGEIINNCHHFHARDFERYRLSVAQITEKLALALTSFFQIRPQAQCLISLSPVRHLKDGFTENQLSKASLLLAIEQILEQFPKNTRYFPAYELLLDDLRDYRFYAEDMLHPNSLATQYIWEHFQAAELSPKEETLRTLWQQLRQAQAHRPLHPERAEYRQFLEKQITKIELHEKQYPKVSFKEIKEDFKFKLNKCLNC